MGHQLLLLVTVGLDFLLRVVFCEGTSNFPELTGMLIQWASIFSNQYVGCRPRK